MDSVDNQVEVSNSEKQEANTKKIAIKEIVVKPHQGLNESNLMTLPFISLKRKKVPKLNRKWIKDNKEVGLKVVGGENGCPTMYDLDVLLALFRLMLKNMDNKYELKDNKVEFSKKINFTYRKLAKEAGMTNYGSAIKNRLEKSIKTLNETTIYSTFAFRDQEQGKSIKTFKGESSCRILTNYKYYSIEERKFNDEKLACAKTIEEETSIEIDDFFFNNICNNYFKLYDHDKYIRLKSNIAKKLLLILTQWSHGAVKVLTMQTVYDYIGIDIDNKSDQNYYNNEIRKALKELKMIGFVQDYEFNTGINIRFIFNVTVLNSSRFMDRYTTDNEVVGRLYEIGITFEEITRFCRMDTMDYVSALLRYVDFRCELGLVEDVKKFTGKGLPYGRYQVDDFKTQI